MSHCHTCKLAAWQRNESGRLLSKRAGQCLWTGRIVVPASAHGEPVREFKGGYIWWKDNVKCPTYRKDDKT